MQKPSDNLTSSLSKPRRGIWRYRSQRILYEPHLFSKRTGFSLLELVAVLVVLGLISALGFLSVAGQLDQSNLIRVLQLIADADRKERIAARQSPTPGELSIENKMQRLEFKCSHRIVELHNSVKIAEAWVDASQSKKESIVYSQTGQSPTFAICLKSSRGAIKWIVIIGISGQIIVTDQSSEVRSLFAMGA